MALIIDIVGFFGLVKMNEINPMLKSMYANNLVPNMILGKMQTNIRPLKWYVSWVQNVVRQFGLYPVEAFEP